MWNRHYILNYINLPTLHTIVLLYSSYFYKQHTPSSQFTFQNSMYLYYLQIPCKCEYMLQDLAASGISLVCGVHFGSSWLCLPTPQDQSVQSGQSNLPVHHSSWLRHHVSRGTGHPESVVPNYCITDHCSFFLYWLEQGSFSKTKIRFLSRSSSLWRWYINTIIVFLDIIHRPVFQNTTFQRLNSLSVFMWNLLSFA
jgi:hypothetical protein